MKQNGAFAGSYPEHIHAWFKKFTTPFKQQNFMRAFSIPLSIEPLFLCFQMETIAIRKMDYFYNKLQSAAF